MILGSILSKLRRGKSLDTIAQERTLRDSHAREFYAQFIHERDLVFDIGANVGSRTRVFAELGRLVVALEPQDSCMRILHAEFKDNGKVTLVQKAVGAREGSAEMMISSAPTLSSLSSEWVRAVQATGRFSGHTWDGRRVVGVTTLDRLIEDFGVPGFIKVDVEGYEAEVLAGLSKLVRCISFEFTPEYLSSALESIRRLCSLGKVRFNYSLGESMRLAMKEWVSPEDIAAVLADSEKTVFGDVYARSEFQGECQSGSGNSVDPAGPR